MNQPNHIRFIVGCILIIVLSCIVCGTYLFIAGYQSGELLIGIAGSGTGALGGMIAMRGGGTPTTASGAVATEVTNLPSNPLPVTQTEQ